MSEAETKENSPVIVSEDKQSIKDEEKILNEENELKKSTETVEEKKIKDAKEGMEVKPKKIPIGGIQMPGFFTRSKSKEQCKEDDQADETELMESEDKKNEESSAVAGSKIKLPSLFKKNKAVDVETGERTAESKDKLKLLETIRQPIVSVFQRLKLNASDPHNLSNNISQAGLASMETLDDSKESKTAHVEEKTPSEKPPHQDQQQEIHWTQKLKEYKIAIGGAVLFLLIVIIIIICTIGGGPAPLRSPPLKDGKFIVTITSCGKVEGKMEDSSFAFRGIPYARPPIDELRFKYAKPLDKIDYCWNETLLAHNATPTCLQIDNKTITGVEDCLTLDVVTPYVRYDNPLPVIVLIGADSFIGGSPGKMRPSARYARSRDVVFVRPNFRMGILGFLSLEMLTRSDYPLTSGNYGLSDILQALKWIQLNIEHFGGDKKSVTLFGHKAGATLVTALASLPDAKKYFTRAWASSGGAVYPQKPRSDAELEFSSFQQNVDCDNVECLRKIDARKLIESVPFNWIKPQADLPSKQEEAELKRHQWLVIDGKFLKESPNNVWMENRLSVDLIIGSTAQSADSEALRLKHKNWTSSLIRHHIKESFIGVRNLTEETLKKYPQTYKGLSTLVTDIRIVCPLYEIWSQMNNVTFYVVNRTRGENNLADIDTDIDAILGRYEPETTEQRRYFSAMQGFFYHFVWHGKVEEKFKNKKVLIIDQDVSTNATYSHCDYWILNNFVLRFAALD